LTQPQLAGVLVAGQKLEKQKRNWLGDRENRHTDLRHPQNWKLKTQLRDPFCAHNFLAEPLGIKKSSS